MLALATAVDLAHFVSCSMPRDNSNDNSNDKPKMRLINRQELCVSKILIGSGMGTKIFKGIWRGNKVAVKEIDINHFYQWQEVEIATTVDHRNIIEAYGYSILDSRHVYLVMEYSFTDTLDYVLKKQKLDLATILQISLDIAAGIRIL